MSEEENIIPIKEGIPIQPNIPYNQEFKAKMLRYDGITCLDMPVDQILEGAIGKLDAVVVVGWGKNGEFYGSSSISDGGAALWLLELCKNKLFSKS